MRTLLGIWMARLARAAFALACVAVAAYAFAYLYMEYRSGDPFAARFSVSGWDVPAHFFGAGLALLLVPVQLAGGLRRRWPAFHRSCGWLYAAAVLIGGLSGLSLAQHAQGGLPSRTGFTLLSLLWLAATGNGIRLAVRGAFDAHRRWMAYSVAMTSAAITLRLILGIGAGALQLPFMPVYITAAWASWLLNLAVCAWLLRATARGMVTPAAARAAPRGGGDRRWGFRRQGA